jgi:GDP-L-fucose synthase
VNEGDHFMKMSGKILVTGGSGLIGRTLVSSLRESDHEIEVFSPGRGECDFSDRAATQKYFAGVRPDLVFHLAAKTGGILANSKDQAGFLLTNLRISENVLEACRDFKVKKVVQPVSSCVYPRECVQPMPEEALLTGALEPTNEGFALAKIAALRLGRYYHEQHGLKVAAPVASGVYGPGDTYDLERSHVLSALVRRFCEAKGGGLESVTLWGTGKPRRQFTHVTDMVRALIFFMEKVDTPDHINVGPEEDCSIRELAELIREAVDFRGKIEWDASKPDGMPRKCLKVDKAKALGFACGVQLRDGIAGVIRDFMGRKGAV